MEIINDVGFENFDTQLILEYDIDDLDSYEMYFIDKFKSYDPKIGYNSQHVSCDGKIHHNVETLTKMKKSHIGKYQSPETKIKRSNKIFAIKDNTIIISDSAKLFGDYIGKSKDIIKNGLRKPVKIDGYMVFY